MGFVDHFFALAPSIRPSATAKKPISIACWTILTCSVPISGRLAASLRSAALKKNLSGATDQLRLPLRDLIRVNVILRAQVGQRLLALNFWP